MGNQRPDAKVANIFLKCGPQSDFRSTVLLLFLEYDEILPFKLLAHYVLFLTAVL